MQTYFYKLSGGINQSCSKTALGLDTKKMYWSDSKNIETLQNSGIVRQKGNVLLAKLANDEKIVALHEIKPQKNILIATSLGNLYVYRSLSRTFVQLNKTFTPDSKVAFVDYLDGIVVGTDNDTPFYVNNDYNFSIEDCNLKDFNGNDINSNIICVYAGRVWVAKKSTLYFSALGKYDDFSTQNDAGYINNFHTDTNDIFALKTYKDYLAIYKENSVFLLSGKNQDEFSIIPFADKGTKSFSAVVNVNNKQYFINQGVFSLEQVGLLSQMQLGEEISLNIKPEFEKFDKTRFDEIIILNYPNKNQAWFLIPYKNDNYFHTIWIYNYIEHAWFKRVIPQNITASTLYDNEIITGDEVGNIYIENFGSTFNGQAIEFMWKSPFLASGNSNVRKTIEEFYFVLDESYDNNFKFSVFKDYDDREKSDEDTIYSNNAYNLMWGEENSSDINDVWDDAEHFSQWAVTSEFIHKAEISESNYSIQLCVEGNAQNKGVAIIGLEFKEIYLDE